MLERPVSYNLEERVAVYGTQILLLCKNLPRDPISTPLIIQLVKSGTSIGANYMEANGASSPKDFINKIYISKKEAQETKYWLRLLEATFPEHASTMKSLWTEAHELTLIFQKIISTAKQKLS